MPKNKRGKIKLDFTIDKPAKNDLQFLDFVKLIGRKKIEIVDLKGRKIKLNFWDEKTLSRKLLDEKEIMKEIKDEMTDKFLKTLKSGVIETKTLDIVDLEDGDLGTFYKKGRKIRFKKYKIYAKESKKKD